VTDTHVAIITGAASGIGQALTVAYAEIGVAVVGGFLPADPHDPACTEHLARAAGGRCVMMPVDVTSAEQVDALAQCAVDEFGRLDFAVANAGLLRQAPLTEMRDDCLKKSRPLRCFSHPIPAATCSSARRSARTPAT
jgi:3-oxoacyl-[acyl-carrier protein] reductase